MKKIIILFLLIFIIAAGIFYYLQPKGPWQERMINLHVPAVGIGEIKAGKITNIEVIGQLEKGVPAPKNAVFNVASLTKPIFGMTIMKLVETGSWDLDEPLYPYFVDKDITEDERHKQLTARICLSHQTGFPNWRWNLKDEKLAIQFDPGTKFEYSGEGYEYLRFAVENRFQMPFEDITDSLLFRPLKMENTSYLWDDKLTENRFAKWHNKSGELYDTFKRTHANAADDILTTVEDYCNFGLAMMNGSFFEEATFEQIVQGEVKIGGDKMQGLGWMLIKDLPNNEYAMVHGGGDMGVRTLAIFLPKSQDGLVLFTNGDKGMDIIVPLVMERLTLGKDIAGKM